MAWIVYFKRLREIKFLPYLYFALVLMLSLGVSSHANAPGRDARGKEGQEKEGQNSQNSSPKIEIPLWTMLLNVHDSEELPYRLRTTWDKVPDTVDPTGLSNLKLMGSAQFSEFQFKALVGYLEKFDVSPRQLVVVDLREEPHAFVNGHAFVWYAQGAWWTQNAPVAYVVKAEEERLNALRLEHTITLKRSTGKDKAGNIKGLKEYSYKIDSLKTEEEVVREAGAHYIRLPVTDHMRPEDKDVDQFLDVVKTLPSEAALYVHCHAGRGRTSTFMIMYDMIRNPKLSFQTIINRQVQLGSLDVRELSGPLKRHKHPNEEFRIRFITQFYEYVNSSEGYGKTTWTKWISNRYNKFGEKNEKNNTKRNTRLVAAARG
jgi:hypothetical protein